MSSVKITALLGLSLLLGQATWAQKAPQYRVKIVKVLPENCETPSLKIGEAYRDSELNGEAFLSAGNYAVSSTAVRKKQKLVDEIYELPNFTLNLKSDTTLRLVYQKRPGSGMVYMPDKDFGILAFSESSIAQANSQPDLRLQTPSLAMLCASDPDGNLWYWDQEALHRIPNAQLKASGKVNPDLHIGLPQVSDALFNTNAMKFDAQGRLYFSLAYEEKILVFDLKQLKGKKAEAQFEMVLGVSPFDFAFNPKLDELAVVGPYSVSVYDIKPDGKLEVKAQGEGIGSHTSVAYDAQGNLWASSENGGIFCYKRHRIESGKMPVGSHDFEIITRDYLYWGIGFDKAGNLYASPRWTDGEQMLDSYRAASLKGQSIENADGHLPGTRMNQHGKFHFYPSTQGQ